MILSNTKYFSFIQPIINSYFLEILFAIIVFIIPVFQEMFSGMGGNLPAPTQLVVSISEVVKNNFLFIILFFICNGIALWVYALDKMLARKGTRRISERALLMFTLMGPIGGVVGVYKIRHKSKKVSYLIQFYLVLLISFVVWGAIGFLLFSNR